MEESRIALVKCPECGKEISDKAKACPNCGAPVAKKFCQHCGEKIDQECVVCPKCGKQVGQLRDDKIIINNSVSSSASAAASANAKVYIQKGKRKNKWVAFFLCLFTICGHKFYEGKAGMGVLYLLTFGLFGIGWLVDLISILGKPNPYYV